MCQVTGHLASPYAAFLVKTYNKGWDHSRATRAWGYMLERRARQDGDPNAPLSITVKWEGQR